ncbi:MAG: ChaN family lipoprotein, partial [FCB group bacterium]
MKKLSIFLITIFFIFYSYATAERKYAIYETATGEKLSINEWAEKSLKYDVIFFGEFHDDTLIHQLQKEYLTALYEKNSNIAVSMEMFERDAQNAINDYLNGKLSEEDFLKRSRPWPDYKTFYRPLLELAKSHNAPVIAANVPRKYASMYSNDGMAVIDKLPASERGLIAAKMKIKEDEYQKMFYKTMYMNLGVDSNATLTPNQENTMYLYYGAQCLKDETMAESIINFLFYSTHADYKLIHFNGDFHSNNYLGTVQKVWDRKKDVKIAVITPLYVDAGKNPDFDATTKGHCDYLIVLENKPQTPVTQSMMGGHLGENYIMSHKININIEPSKHFIEGTDTFKFKNPILKKASVNLLKDLSVESFSSPNGEVDYKISEIKNDSLYQSIIFSGRKGEISELVIKYKGEVYHSPNVTLLNQKHSNTPGIISDAKSEGIYLPGGSYFPQADKDLANFDVKVTVPKEMVMITSGTLVSSNTFGDKITYNYKTELQTDDVILVGGRYVSIDSIYDGKKFSVFTFEKSNVATTYLNASIEYYNLYTKLFGPYPYKSFSIVENFFATGFGMPGYTLLSNKLMAMPFILLNPGSLAHEFVHNWWGNSIYVDYNLGNWCEALTTFSANYYYNVLTKKDDAALDWRKKALLSMESLPEKNNYPVIKFKSQQNNDDATVGYQKGAFVFYEVYKLLGEQRFFQALKNFAVRLKGRRTQWFVIFAMFKEQIM